MSKEEETINFGGEGGPSLSLSVQKSQTFFFFFSFAFFPLPPHNNNNNKKVGPFRIHVMVAGREEDLASHPPTYFPSFLRGKEEKKGKCCRPGKTSARKRHLSFLSCGHFTSPVRCRRNRRRRRRRRCHLVLRLHPDKKKAWRRPDLCLPACVYVVTMEEGGARSKKFGRLIADLKVGQQGRLNGQEVGRGDGGLAVFIVSPSIHY